jgi:hypothetical protein
MDNQIKETQQSTTSCSGRNVGHGSNGNNNGNCNDGSIGGDDDNGSGRRMLGRCMWGGCQAAKGGRNGNKVEMGTMWV